MNKKNLKISYDKESKVFSVEIKKGKSVDSDIFDNVVIDYDRQGKIVRVNFYSLNFDVFKENLRELKNISRDYKIPLLVK